MTSKKTFLALAAFVLLLTPAPGLTQETEMNALIRVIEDNQIRIQRLERTVDDLRSQVRDLEDQLVGGGAEAPADPIIGSWECTNDVFTYAIFFDGSGQVVQQEPTFGNARNTTWSRLNETEILVAGQVALGLDFYSDDSLTITDGRNKTSWECNRK